MDKCKSRTGLFTSQPALDLTPDHTGIFVNSLFQLDMNIVPLVFCNPSCHSNADCNARSDGELTPTPSPDRGLLLRLPTELLIDIAAILDTEYREDRHGVDLLPVLRR